MGVWLGRLIVAFVFCLISFIAYSSQIFIIWPWYGSVVSIELLELLVPFNLLVGMLLWNYFLCVLIDPGRVPQSWRPDTSVDGYEVKKLTGQPRFCKMCDNYKPPRSHHCRQCNKCMLRMDHHCPWVNNCVGHFNYGHFIRFLFFVDVACSYHLAMVTRRVYEAIGRRYWDYLSGTELVFIILNYVACVPVILSVGAFSIYHFLGLLGNTTTIEGWEKDKAATMVRRGRIREIKFPYDLGRRRNIEAALGKNVFLWCWPTMTPGDGLSFELGDKQGVEVEAQWPPRDPNYENGFHLPESPWTYENGSFNPELVPSNGQRRRTPSRRRRVVKKIDSVPPYHPDYGKEEVVYEDYTTASEDEVEDHAGRTLFRRGSEGYEVRAVDREAMLDRYLKDLGEVPGRYNRYVPEESPPPSETDDDIPLGSRAFKQA